MVSATDGEEQRRAKGAGSVKELPNGKWRARVTVGYSPAGVPQRIERLFASERAAEQGVKRLQAEAEVAKLKGERPGSARGRRKEKPVDGPMTVRAWIEERYLPAYVTRVTPKTYNTVRSALARGIEALGDRTLDSLTPADFTRLADATQAETSDINAFNAVRHLRTALMAAGSKGHPVPHWLVFWTPGKQVKVRKRRREPFGAEDAQKLFKATRDDPQEHLRIKLGVYLGIRLGGVRGLRWQEVDLEAKQYRVRWQLQPLPYDGPRRLGKFRVPDDFEVIRLVDSLHLVRPKWMRDVPERDLPVLPMPDDLVDAFKAWQKVAPRNAWDLVFTDDGGGYPRRENTDRDRWREAQERAGVTKPDGTPYTVHEMRHSAATLLAELGVPREVIASILGHADVSTTGIYAKESAKQREKALKKVERALKDAAKHSGDETDEAGQPDA